MRNTDLWRDWNVVHIATHRNGSVSIRLIAFAVGYGRFLCHSLVKRPNIVHIHMSSYGSFARKYLVMWTAKAFGLPVVLHIHGSQFNEFARSTPRPLRAIIRTTLEHADAVIALGNVWADDLQTIAPRADIEVVPNAVRPHRPVQQAVTGPIHVAFLGEVGARKGTFVLLEAWSKLVAMPGCRPARLTISGDGEVERARQMVSELGIQTSVDVRGWLPETEVAALLDDAHVLVLPSQNEGQPMAILEAMARGICVIASTVGGIPEMLGDAGGILVEPEDVGAVTNALVRVVNDSDARTQYGEMALSRVDAEFHIETAARRIDRLYCRVMERRNKSWDLPIR